MVRRNLYGSLIIEIEQPGERQAHLFSEIVSINIVDNKVNQIKISFQKDKRFI